MNTPVNYIQTEPKLTAKAKEIAKQQGKDLSVEVNHFLEEFIASATNLFIKKKETDSDPGLRPTPYLKRVIHQAEKDLKAGKGSPTFDNAEDAIAYLEKQGI